MLPLSPAVGLAVVFRPTLLGSLARAPAFDGAPKALMTGGGSDVESSAAVGMTGRGGTFLGKLDVVGGPPFFDVTGDSALGPPFIADDDVAHGLPFAVDDDVAHGLPFAVNDDVAHGLPFAVDADVTAGPPFSVEEDVPVPGPPTVDAAGAMTTDEPPPG